MSLNINWEKIKNDLNLKNEIVNKLTNFLNSIQLPSYLSEISVEDINLGNTGPKITIKQINDPIDEFYESVKDEVTKDDNKESGDNTNQFVEPSIKNDFNDMIINHDIQIVSEFKYNDPHFEIILTGILSINYPDENFLKLPVKLKISNFKMNCLLLIAYLANEVFVSILCDIEEEENDESNHNTGNSNDLLDRISIIEDIRIETEIGETEFYDINGNLNSGSVLKNVDIKLQEFLIEKFKNFIKDELAWPNWINFDFNE